MEEENIYPIFDRMLSRKDKEELLGQRGVMLWLTGLSGSGKSTIAIALERELHKRGLLCRILDGDNIRSGINNNLGFSAEDRVENIPIVPLYFAKERPVVNIDGNLIMADDDRLPEEYRDRIEMKEVRFRTLGCWPLTGAVESDADTIEKIVEEMMTTTKSERTTRVIDFDQDASMEQKKREGYF